MSKYWRRTGIATGLSLFLVAAGCGTENEAEDADPDAEDNGDAEETEEDDADAEDDADSEASADYAEEMDYTITGIDGGAGFIT